jgi:hypothetical protein
MIANRRLYLNTNINFRRNEVRRAWWTNTCPAGIKPAKRESFLASFARTWFSSIALCIREECYYKRGSPQEVTAVYFWWQILAVRRSSSMLGSQKNFFFFWESCRISSLLSRTFPQNYVQFVHEISLKTGNVLYIYYKNVFYFVSKCNQGAYFRAIIGSLPKI